MINIKMLKIQGFKSFKEEQTYEFDTFKNVMIFVEGQNEVTPELGANGSGKTSMWEALCWCLFGKTSRKIKGKKALENWDKKDKCKVTVVFSVDKNNHTNTIVRTISPNQVRYNDEIVTQETLEETLGLNFETFLQAVYISQFAEHFFSKTSGEMLSELDKVLYHELNMWDHLLESAKRDMGRLDNDIFDQENAIFRTNGMIQAIQEGGDVEYYTQLSDEWIMDQKQQAKLLTEKLEGTAQEKQTLVLRKSLLEKQKTNCKEEARKSQQASIQLLETELETLNTEKYELVGELSGLKEKRKSLLEFLDSLTETAEYTTCPTCLQDVCFEVIEKNYKEKCSELEILDGVITKVNEAIEENKQKLEKCTSQLVTVKKQLESSVDKVHEIIRDIDSANKLLQDYDEVVKDFIEILKRLKTERNPYHDKAKEVEDRLIKAQEELESLTKQNKLTRQDHSVCSYWYKTGFKKLKLEIIEQALQEISYKYNDYLIRLGMVGWSVDLVTGRETTKKEYRDGLTVWVKSPSNEEMVQFECYSGGENGRLMLAGTLAMLDFLKGRGYAWNIEIWDEPTRWLSTQGIDSFLEVLRDRLEEDTCIFVTDHKNLKSHGNFEINILVVLNETGSQIEY